MRLLSYINYIRDELIIPHSNHIKIFELKFFVDSLKDKLILTNINSIINIFLFLNSRVILVRNGARLSFTIKYFLKNLFHLPKLVVNTMSKKFGSCCHWVQIELCKRLHLLKLSAVTKSTIFSAALTPLQRHSQLAPPPHQKYALFF